VDQNRFDTLTRTFLTVRSRRAALGTLFAGTLGLLDLAETSARKRCGPCKRRSHGKCKPKLNGTACSAGTCQDGQCLPSTEASPEPSRTCPTGECSRKSPCGDGCVCLDIGGGTKRCLSLGSTCSGIGDCQANPCAGDCTCVNPGGRRSGCASTAGCPPDKGKCTPDNGYCGSDCICVGTGAAARCVSRVRTA
jgi:hypothetical protein